MKQQVETAETAVATPCCPADGRVTGTDQSVRGSRVQNSSRLDPSPPEGLTLAPSGRAPAVKVLCFRRSSLVHGTEAHAADDVGFGLGALGDGWYAESVFLVEVDDERGEVLIAAISQCAGEPLGG